MEPKQLKKKKKKHKRTVLDTVKGNPGGSNGPKRIKINERKEVKTETSHHHVTTSTMGLTSFSGLSEKSTKSVCLVHAVFDKSCDLAAFTRLKRFFF